MDSKFAVFKDDRQVSKAHSTHEAALIEAYELGVVFAPGLPDFPGDPVCETVALAEGYSIRKARDNG